MDNCIPIIEIEPFDGEEYYHCNCCFSNSDLYELSFKREKNKRRSGGTQLFICKDCIELLKDKLEEV